MNKTIVVYVILFLMASCGIPTADKFDQKIDSIMIGNADLKSMSMRGAWALVQASRNKKFCEVLQNGLDTAKCVGVFRVDYRLVSMTGTSEKNVFGLYYSFFKDGRELHSYAFNTAFFDIETGKLVGLGGGSKMILDVAAINRLEDDYDQFVFDLEENKHTLSKSIKEIAEYNGVATL